MAASFHSFLLGSSSLPTSFRAAPAAPLSGRAWPALPHRGTPQRGYQRHEAPGRAWTTYAARQSRHTQTGSMPTIRPWPSTALSLLVVARVSRTGRGASCRGVTSKGRHRTACYKLKAKLGRVAFRGIGAARWNSGAAWAGHQGGTMGWWLLEAEAGGATPGVKARAL